MNKLKVGSDFSGVGAFRQAMLRLNCEHETLFSCDVDKFARTTYIENYGTASDVELLNNPEYIRIANTYHKLFVDSKATRPTEEEIKFANENCNEVARRFSFYYPWNVYDREIPAESLDVYMTSPPCQSFSMAGKRLGKDDLRGVLFFNSHKFIAKNKPRFFIFENVKGLLSDDDGNTFKEWELMLGGKSVNGNPVIFPYENSLPYHIYYKVVNAKDHDVPQDRERVFIVGIRDDADNVFTWPKDVSLTKRLRDILDVKVNEKYFLSNKMLEYFDNRASNFNNGKINFKDEDSIASTITSSCKSIDISDNIIKLTNVNPSGNGLNGNVYGENGVSPTLLTNKGEGIKVCGEKVDRNSKSDFKILGYTRDSKGKVTSRHEKDISGTIHTCSGGGGNTDQFVLFVKNTSVSKYAKFNNLRIRRLTPRECFRLMDFPETFTFNLVSDSQAYKQAGNSIVVKPLHGILNGLKTLIVK